MKKIITLLLFAFVITSATAQSKDQKAIKKVIAKVIELNEAGKYKESLDYTYPGLFELVSRELLEEELDKILGDNGELTIAMKNFDMGDVGEVISTSSADVAITPYSFTLMMTFKEEMDATTLGFVAEALKNQFGADNVDIDEETGTLIIDNQSRMLAIKENGTNDWTLLELKQEQIEMYELILPEDIYKLL